MTAKRLFHAGPIAANARLELGPDQARYLGRALRMKPGDELKLFNGEDGEWLARLEAIGRNSAEATVLEHRATATESTLRLHLVQGISRGERMDLIVQKATELGVKRITPVLSDHGMVKLEGSRAGKRREHWQAIATSACEQCGRIRPPLVDAPIPLNDWFGCGLDIEASQLILRPGAARSLTAQAAPETKLVLLVGPEGGFSAREYEDAEAAGFMAVALGPRILRTETAAIAALTLAQSAWGDLQT